MERGFSGFTSVFNVFEALGRFQYIRDLFAVFVEFFLVLAVDVDRHSGTAEQSRHIAHAVERQCDRGIISRYRIFDIGDYLVEPVLGQVIVNDYASCISSVRRRTGRYRREEAQRGACVHDAYLVNSFDRHDMVYYFIRDLIGFFPRHLGRSLDVDLDLVGCYLGQIHDTHVDDCIDRHSEQYDRQQERYGLELKAPLQTLAVSFEDLIEKRVLLGLGILHER